MKELQEAVTPAVGLFAAEGDNMRPLVEIVKEVPDRLTSYMHDMARSYVQ